MIEFGSVVVVLMLGVQGAYRQGFVRSNRTLWPRPPAHAIPRRPLTVATMHALSQVLVIFVADVLAASAYLVVAFWLGY